MSNDVLLPRTFADFPTTFKGETFRPSDDGYAEVRKIWNMRRGDEQPALIVQALDADDVVIAVNYAVAQDVSVAVKGGGHGIDGMAMPHDALVIDTSKMRAISVDPDTKRITIEAGVLLGEMDAAGQQHGLVVPAGVVSDTGAVGLTLGGGIGHLTRRFGATVDSVLSVDVVTMDGRKATASADSNEDLFWGLRGAGHNLAIATSLTYQGHAVGPDVMSGLLVYSAEDAVPVIAGLDQAMARSPRELSVALLVMPAPPIPGLPEHLIGTPILINLVVYTGPLDQFDEAMREIRNLPAPLADMVGPSTWVETNSIVDSFEATGRRQYLGGGYMPSLNADVARIALERIAASPRPATPGPSAIITLPILGGAIHDRDENSTAFSRSGAAWLYEVAGQWDLPTADEEFLTWIQDTMTALAPHVTVNGYINLSSDRGAEWLRGQYGSPEKWERVAALKRTWDPDNRLSYNKNVARAFAPNPA